MKKPVPPYQMIKKTYLLFELFPRDKSRVTKDFTR